MSQSEVSLSEAIDKLDAAAKLNMEWSNYDKCIRYLNHIINEKTRDGGRGSIVGIHRGSLGMAAHLSNLSGLPMSIIKFQTYNGNDKEPILIWTEINNGDIIFLCDDIIDTGNTMKKCIEFFKVKYPKSEVYPMALMGSDKKYTYCYEHNNEWVIFPWEKLSAFSSDSKEWEERQSSHGQY
jgi:hypoxanthine phosphoribosyltransferase